MVTEKKKTLLPTMALFVLIVFEIFVLLLSLKDSFAEEPRIIKTTKSVFLEDFQRKIRLVHNITKKQLDQSGFIKIRKDVWYKTVLWQGSYSGPVPLLCERKLRSFMRNRTGIFL
jgi:hypothetical protein